VWKPGDVEKLMVVDHVHDYGDLALMALFNELFELLRSAIFGLWAWCP
jgi:hypothetical protein